MTSEGQCGNTFSLEAKGNLHLLHLYIVARFITFVELCLEVCSPDPDEVSLLLEGEGEEEAEEVNIEVNEGCCCCHPAEDVWAVVLLSIDMVVECRLVLTCGGNILVFTTWS